MVATRPTDADDLVCGRAHPTSRKLCRTARHRCQGCVGSRNTMNAIVRRRGWAATEPGPGTAAGPNRYTCAMTDDSPPPTPTFDDLSSPGGTNRRSSRRPRRASVVGVAESSDRWVWCRPLCSPCPEASAFYLGGSVIYTGRARRHVVRAGRPARRAPEGATEDYAETTQPRAPPRNSRSDWAVAETGASGPVRQSRTATRLGHSWVAVADPDGEHDSTRRRYRRRRPHGEHVPVRCRRPQTPRRIAPLTTPR